MRTHRIYDRYEKPVFCLLRCREFVIRHEAGMLLLGRVFRRTILPTGRFLFFQPFFVTVARLAAGIRQMEFDAIDGARSLPVEGIFPRQLAVVTERLTVGSVPFVAHFCYLFCVHTMWSNMQPTGESRSRLLCLSKLIGGSLPSVSLSR